MRDAIPILVSRGSHPPAWANLLVFGLAALGAEWIVHQTEYLIEYGQRFGLVMATTPHRLYMSLLGAALAVCGLLLCALIMVLLRLGSVRLRGLVAGMPAWLHTRVPSRHIRLPVGATLGGAALLALLQMTIYVIQENLEMLSVNAGLPGLGVLAARQHATVVPLHILLAFITSLLLWTVASWLGVLHAAVAAAEALHRWTHRWDAPPQAPAADGAGIVRRYLAAARRSLRSPPLPA